MPFKVTKGEVEEIRNLVVTNEDRAAGKALSLAVYSACMVYGVPCPEKVQNIVAVAGAYAVRDAKEGIKTPTSLIIGRVVEELKDIYRK